MAQTANLSAQNRTALGSRANKRLRDTGLVPGVVYGHKQDVLPISLPKKELVNFLEHGAHLFALNLDGKNENVLVKEVQYDHLGLDVLHVDFARVDLNERVQVTVPLELKGEPKGESEGGVLTQLISDLEVECVVTDIPEIIRHNVSEMGLDSVLHIKDIALPSGVKALQDGELIVATVKEVKEEVAAAAAPAAEGAGEPEVIGKKEKDEADAAAAAAPAAGAAKK
jgi:large subunit ribosomal protein L25